jgi:hypothetical protein
MFSLFVAPPPLSRRERSLLEIEYVAAEKQACEDIQGYKRRKSKQKQRLRLCGRRLGGKGKRPLYIASDVYSLQILQIEKQNTTTSHRHHLSINTRHSWAVVLKSLLCCLLSSLFVRIISTVLLVSKPFARFLTRKNHQAPFSYFPRLFFVREIEELLIRAPTLVFLLFP